MDHNNKHLLPGFQFPAAFAGLANVSSANASLLSALSHLSTLNSALLPAATINPTELAQWAAAQQSNQQAWLEQMLPSLYLSSVADIKSFQLAQQALQQQVVNGTSSSAIFPSLLAAAAVAAPHKIQPTTKLIPTLKTEPVESPIAVEPLSNASSSHQSTSTPQEIDVGVLTQPSSVVQIELSERVASPTVRKTSVVCEPSTSTSSLLPSTTATSDSQRVISNAELAQIDPVELATSMFEKRPPPKEIQRSKSESVIPTSSAAASSSSAPPPSAPPTKRRFRGEDEPDEHDVTQELFTEFRATDKDEAGVFGIFAENTGMGPVQFTPPDSPTGMKEEPESVRPTPSSTPFLPAPAPTPAPVGAPSTSGSSTSPPKAAPRPSIFQLSQTSPMKPSYRSIAPPPAASKGSSKVPIYKQKRMASYRMANTMAEKDVAGGDAYSFEDEEDNSLAKIQSAKERLDQKVKEKLQRLAGQSGDKNKNVYVPGVGFAVPQEQPQQDLWRNVVLKKRPVENRPAVPAANLLPAAAHAEACQAAARLAEPEIVTLAESLRRRKKSRFVCSFIKTEGLLTTDNTSFKEDGAEYKYADSYSQANAEAAPKLPKLVIKLSRKSVEDHEEKKEKKKKKKRKREEDDSDWEGDRRSKKHRHKRKKSERRDSAYALRVVASDDFDDDIKQEPPEEPSPQPVKVEPPPVIQHTDAYNPKKRFLQQWTEQAKQEEAKYEQHMKKEQDQPTKHENGQLKYNGVEGIKPTVRKTFTDFNGDAIKQRLSKFSQADGHITKGCFVVAKSELFREDCALWKVDNPNMLQKFPPRVDPTTKNVSYKNSSTYSGWCEQISSGYYKVAVRFIKQSRSETIVEPEIPLSDLFPAMTSGCTDNNGLIIPEEEGKPDPNEHVNILRDQRRMSLYILNRELVDHALTMDHIQLLKDKNDWNFLKALTDIEKLNNECMNRLRAHTSIKEELEDMIKDYTKLLVSDTQKESSGFISLYCQACKNDKTLVEKVIQLLGRQGYCRETLKYADKVRARRRDEDDIVEVEPLIATELYLCNDCATAAKQFHRCYHMVFDLLKFAEDKLEALGTIHSDYKPETIVEMAKKARTWQNNVFLDVMEMWKKIETTCTPVTAPVAAASDPPAATTSSV